MESSVRLGRIAGIEIGINWSWLVVFTLITWSLAAGVFPSRYPGLADGALQPGYAGIRPRLGPVGSAFDFMIQGPAEHGIAGLVNLFGIESPGLTASLAIAEEVAAALLRGNRRPLDKAV